MTEVHVTDVFVEIARRHRDGWTEAELAQRFGISTARVHQIVGNDRGARSKAALKKIEAARLARNIPPDTRDTTAIICGDPLPGRSAYDAVRRG